MKELIGNPALNGNIAYAPECVYSDNEGKERIYDKMWTGESWWCDIQVCWPTQSIFSLYLYKNPER
jgi:hypothetical protein